MIADRDIYLQRLSLISWRTGTIPAMRGRILDKNGNPIAWSIRYFSLYYNVPKERTRFREDILSLNKILTIDDRFNYLTQPGKSISIKEELSPGEILKLRSYLQSNSRFRIRSNFRREYARNDAEALKIIGRTRVIESKEVGISGLENEYNARLTGIDGRYRVMVDKDNTWISATWDEIQSPFPGFDVYVPIELERVLK